MPIRSPLAAALAVFAVHAAVPDLAGAETKPNACVADNAGKITCGSGPGALFVLDGTTSPSGKLAIAWRSKDESTGDVPDPESVENHLVRLADGKRLALVVGRAWDTGTARGNHIYQTAVWSPDSRWLLVGDGGKWALEALAIYSIDASGDGVKSLGLFRAISAAAGRALNERLGKSKAAGYLLDIAGDQKIEVVNTGSVSMPMLFQVPKEDKDIGLLVRFKASRSGERVTASPISVSVVERQPN